MATAGRGPLDPRGCSACERQSRAAQLRGVHVRAATRHVGACTTNHLLERPQLRPLGQGVHQVARALLEQRICNEAAAVASAGTWGAVSVHAIRPASMKVNEHGAPKGGHAGARCQMAEHGEQHRTLVVLPKPDMYAATTHIGSATALYTGFRLPEQNIHHRARTRRFPARATCEDGRR